MVGPGAVLVRYREIGGKSLHRGSTTTRVVREITHTTALFVEVRRFATAFLTLGAGMLWSANSVVGQTCVSDADLLQKSEEFALNETPCTSIGAAYIIGIGGRLGEYEGNIHSAEHPYYLLVRYYLAAKRNESSSSMDMLGYLISAAQVLALDPPHEHERRWYSYQAFIVGEYWEAGKEDIDESHKVIADTFKILLGASGFSRFKEIGCFVKYDIPSLPISDVTEAKNFNLCVGEIK